MRRLRPALLVLLACTFAAVVALWIRSYIALDSVTYAMRSQTKERYPRLLGFDFLARIDQCQGSVSLVRTIPAQDATTFSDDDIDRRAKWTVHSTPIDPLEKSPSRPLASFRSAGNWDLLGIGPFYFNFQGTVMRGLTLPHWFLATLVALAISAVALSGRSARRRRAGLCPSCRYDLNSDFTRGCPECGWNPPPDPRAESPAVQ